MLLRIKLVAFASIIIASGAAAAETTQQVVEAAAASSETGLEDNTKDADTADRELYGTVDDDRVSRRCPREDCADDKWCTNFWQCFNSEMAKERDFNGDGPPGITSATMGGCVFKEGGAVSWVYNNHYKFFDENEAPRLFCRVCCDHTEGPTVSPTLSPTWLDDSWGGDKWDGGSTNKWDGGSTNKWSGGNQWNDNKWGWSGGSSSSNNKWGWSGGSSSSNNNKWGWSGGSSSSNNNKWGWSGGSSSNNKWGWSGGSSSNNRWNGDDWGGWEPSMSKWNHDGWHQDGWEDDGWNADGHDNIGWKGDSNNKWHCDLSDCCEAKCRGRSFPLYNQFLNSETSGGCKVRTVDGGTGDRVKCNKMGFCYGTGEGCDPDRDCRC